MHSKTWLEHCILTGLGVRLSVGPGSQDGNSNYNNTLEGHHG